MGLGGTWGLGCRRPPGRRRRSGPRAPRGAAARRSRRCHTPPTPTPTPPNTGASLPGCHRPGPAKSGAPQLPQGVDPGTRKARSKRAHGCSRMQADSLQPSQLALLALLCRKFDRGSEVADRPRCRPSMLPHARRRGASRDTPFLGSVRGAHREGGQGSPHRRQTSRRLRRQRRLRRRGDRGVRGSENGTWSTSAAAPSSGCGTCSAQRRTI